MRDARPIRRRLTTIICLLSIVVGALAGPAVASAGKHRLHGTLRAVCTPTDIRRWPGGPVAGSVKKGEDFRRFVFRGSWAFGTRRDPRVRGYILTSAFCPATKRGRRALERARRLASHRKGLPRRSRSVRPRTARICAFDSYLRKVPLGLPIGLVYIGDRFRVTRISRRGAIGGFAYGHEQRRGWLPRSVICDGLVNPPKGYRRHQVASGLSLLQPPARIPCAQRVSDRKLIQVGALLRQSAARALVSTTVHENGTTHGLGPRFAGHDRGHWSYGAVGPFRCGSTYSVVYTIRGVAGAPQEIAFPVNVNPNRPSKAAAMRRPPQTVCGTAPERRSAHGIRVVANHRYKYRPAVSADGSLVAFDSDHRLTPTDRGKHRDVFVHVRGTRATELISAAPDGQPGRGRSRLPALSADGRFVAFESDAANLVPGDSNGEADVFLRDRQSGVTELISVGPGGSPASGESGSASIDASAGIVAFESRARNLDPQAAGATTIHLRNRASGSTRLLVSLARRPALSADAHFMVFESQRGDLVPGDSNHDWDVFRMELSSGRIELVSARRGGGSPNGMSLAGVPSADGRYVAFLSSAPAIVRGDHNGLRDVFVRDMKSDTTLLVSANRCGKPGNGYSRNPSISADGSLVAFDTHASDIGRVRPAAAGNVYLRDVRREAMRLLSTNARGRPANRTSFSPGLSANGQVVAFPSYAYDIVCGDRNDEVDIFARGTHAHAARRISAATRPC